MIETIMVLLGAFIVFAVVYNILSLQKKPQVTANKTIFNNQQSIQAHTATEEAISDAAIIDPSIQNVSPRFEEPVPAPLQQSSLISLYVMCGHARATFSPFQLLDAIASINCHFGEMSIFHRYENNEENGAVLFSVAQAVSPGVFNLENIESIACPGVVFFMDAAMMDDPYDVFNLMLESAEQLADTLHGELYQTPRKVIDESSQAYYEGQLRYALELREKLQEHV